MKSKDCLTHATLVSKKPTHGFSDEGVYLWILQPDVDPRQGSLPTSSHSALDESNLLEVAVSCVMSDNGSTTVSLA